MSAAAQPVVRFRVGFLFAFLFLVCVFPLYAQTPLPECSPSKTNSDCAIVIDRANPIAPPTIQMYEGGSVTVVLRGPNSFERYFLDYQTGTATLKPDVASSIVQGLLPSLQKAGEIKTLAFGYNPQAPPDVCANITNGPIPKPGDEIAQMVDVATVCVGQLAGKALDIYQKLEPLIAPDALIPQNTARQNNPCLLEDCINTFLQSEISFSAKITVFAKDPTLNTQKNPTYAADMLAIAQLNALQKSADAIYTDLEGYKQRLADLPRPGDLVNWGYQDCAKLVDLPQKVPPAKCIAFQSRADNAHIYHDMVTRSVSYSLDTFNLVSNSQEAAPDPSKKKSLVTITLNFAERPSESLASALRWEASAGVLFSSLPIRSFSVAPVFTNGVVTDKKVSQNLLYPTVVPFAAGNLRLTNDLGWSRWKSNVYWTGAVGVNPNTVSADFATGLSLSWRLLMVSALCHFGHDVRLTQGLTVGQSLGASFNGSPSTETYWRENFALGLSIRVPSLTGR